MLTEIASTCWFHHRPTIGKSIAVLTQAFIDQNRSIAAGTQGPPFGGPDVGEVEYPARPQLGRQRQLGKGGQFGTVAAVSLGCVKRFVCGIHEFGPVNG